MKRRWGKSIKNKVKLLRRQGYSYGRLVKETGIPKSTLHEWIRGLKRPAKFTKLDRIRFIKEIQPLAVQMNKKKREEKIKRIINETQREIALLNTNNELKKSVLAMLYWAEGTKVKGVLQFANTDPRIVLLFVTLLRECYKIDEKKFRLRLHLHYYHRVKEVKKFWSNLLKIPLTQFHKTYRKSRSKEKRFRRNFGGICFIKYNSVYLKERIMQYAYLLAESITGKIDVPVA